MKKYISLIVFLLLSLNVFATSVTYVLEDNSPLRSDKTNNSDTNIIKHLPKDTQLDLLTLHYSGWSQVSFGDTTGWILSNKLTDQAPKKLAKTTTKIDNSKLQKLEKELLLLQNKNKQLSSKTIDIKAFNDQLNVENKALSDQNTMLKAQVDSLPATDSIEWIFALLGLVLGVVISIIFSLILRKKNESFNTIRL